MTAVKKNSITVSHIMIPYVNSVRRIVLAATWMNSRSASLLGEADAGGAALGAGFARDALDAACDIRKVALQGKCESATVYGVNKKLGCTHLCCTPHYSR
jgi:hypothetical protein